MLVTWPTGAANIVVNTPSFFMNLKLGYISHLIHISINVIIKHVLENYNNSLRKNLGELCCKSKICDIMQITSAYVP